ncbi:MAG: replication initiator protein A [Ruminococcaceae bacterium]|nr:replication initiator protein A [Oscillospiraceae bacterium]
MSMVFDYFYGTEAEQFTFFRIPKVLFTDKRFKDMSTDAKLLYGLMLDRMGLSIKNKWLDDECRVYIVYTVDDIIADLGCARQKTAKLLDELETNVGLIERKRQGLGKPNIIYVKNFTYSQSTEYDNQNSGSMNIKNQEVWKSNLQKYENHTSRNMNTELQEVRKSNSNNNDLSDNKNNNTDFNDTILSYPIGNDEDSENEPCDSKNPDMIRWIREHNSYEQLIKKNIEYDIIVETYGAAWLDEIVELMVDVVCSKEPYIRINKQNYPQEVVKSRFLKINSEHIEYIHFALRENTSNVRNIRAFLITTIYRSFETTDNWYSAKVKHDMAHPK